MVIIGVIVVVYTLLPSFGGRNELPLTTVVSMAKNHEIREIVVDGKKLTVFPRSSRAAGSSSFTSRMGSDTDIINLLVESGVSDKAMEGLRAMGHRVQRSVGSFGGYQGILVDRESGVYHAASDNRKDGCAVGY